MEIHHMSPYDMLVGEGQGKDYGVAGARFVLGR